MSTITPRPPANPPSSPPIGPNDEKSNKRSTQDQNNLPISSSGDNKMPTTPSTTPNGAAVAKEIWQLAQSPPSNSDIENFKKELVQFKSTTSYWEAKTTELEKKETIHDQDFLDKKKNHAKLLLILSQSHLKLDKELAKLESAEKDKDSVQILYSETKKLAEIHLAEEKKALLELKDNTQSILDEIYSTISDSSSQYPDVIKNEALALGK